MQKATGLLQKGDKKLFEVSGTGGSGLAVVITITRNWNTWEGGKVEQVTDDAYVRGDLTPLSTKVAGIVGSEPRIA